MSSPRLWPATPTSSSPTTAGSGGRSKLSASRGALSVDDFALGLLGKDRDGVEQVIDDLVAKRVRRRVTRAELLDRIRETFPSLVTALDPDQ